VAGAGKKSHRGLKQEVRGCCCWAHRQAPEREAVWLKPQRGGNFLVPGLCGQMAAAAGVAVKQGGGDGIAAAAAAARLGGADDFAGAAAAWAVHLGMVLGAEWC